MDKEELMAEIEHDEAHEGDEVWNMLTPKQKKYFKRLTEKNEENMKYIG